MLSIEPKESVNMKLLNPEKFLEPSRKSHRRYSVKKPKIRKIHRKRLVPEFIKKESLA